MTKPRDSRNIDELKKYRIINMGHQPTQQNVVTKQAPDNKMNIQEDQT